MKLTAMELREMKLKKAMRGYDIDEVERMKATAADALAEASAEISRLSEENVGIKKRLRAYLENEAMLKKTITAAHMMGEDLKAQAGREREIILAGAKQEADSLVEQSAKRIEGLRSEIAELRRQRVEIQNSVRALLGHHASLLELGEEESRKADLELERLRFFPRK